jgi:pimeloyl-ACP methyl ester carboxylesterase
VEPTATYGVHRSGAGEPIVLIHGFSGTRLMWEPVVAELERSFELMAVSLAGHVGGPELAGPSASVPVLIDAVEADLDQAGWSTAHVVGNSLGGWIALELARRGRARSVVALSPAGGWEPGSRDERRLRPLFARLHWLSRKLSPHLDSLVRRPGLRHQLLWQLMAHGERLSPAATAQLVRDSVQTPVYWELMDAILRDGTPRDFDGLDCPVLLAWGTRDRIIPSPRYSRRLRELIPQAEFVELPGLGHVPMADDPALVARTITQFVQRVGEAAAAPAAR